MIKKTSSDPLSENPPIDHTPKSSITSVPRAVPPFVDVQQLVEVPSARDDRMLRNVVLNGIRKGDLRLKNGIPSLSTKATPQYLSQLAAAVQAPLTISGALRPKDLSDQLAFQEKVFPTVTEYLRELKAASQAINDKFAQVAGDLGRPVTEVEFGGKDYNVPYRKYEHGAIYVSPISGKAFEVHGAIYQKYLALGAEGSFLGFPETDELSTVLGTGRFNHFHGGSIYWTSQTGAWSIHGTVRDKWLTLGADRSYLGFPVSDVENGKVSYFQRGVLGILSDGSVHDFPDSVFFSTPVHGGHVKCSTQFWMNSKGEWHYKGHLHNDGFAGCTATVAASPRFQAAGGQVFVVMAERTLGGSMDTEERNDDWVQTGEDNFIRDNWEFIRFAGIAVTLKTNTQVGDVLNIIWPFVALAVIIFGGGSAKVKVCGPYGSRKRDPWGGDTATVGWELVDEDQPCPGDNSNDLFKIK